MATIGFEEKLWQAADKLRGSMHSAAVLLRLLSATLSSGVFSLAFDSFACVFLSCLASLFYSFLYFLVLPTQV